MDEPTRTRHGRRHVSIVGADEHRVGSIEWWTTAEGGERFGVTLDGPAGRIEAVDADFFGALAGVRRRLERDGWALAVQGARADVYPSAEARRELGAERVYPFDAEGRAAPAVMIFDEADPSVAVSVDDQRAEWDRYLAAPRGRVRKVKGERTIEVLRGPERHPATVRWWLTDDYFSGVELAGPFGREVATATDAFSALAAIRRRIEPAGWRVAVQGARRDAWAGGMLREPGAGDRVVVGAAGEVVGTFDPAEPEMAATWAEQQAHHRSRVGVPEARRG
jgi:hypothetical protein